MAECRPFRYQANDPQSHIDGNGTILSPDIEKRRWIQFHCETYKDESGLYASSLTWPSFAGFDSISYTLLDLGPTSFAIEAENEGDDSGYLFAWGNNASGAFGNGTFFPASKKYGKISWNTQDYPSYFFEFQPYYELHYRGTGYSTGLSSYPTRVGNWKWKSVASNGIGGIMGIRSDGSLWAWGNYGEGLGTLGLGNYAKCPPRGAQRLFRHRAYISSSVESVSPVIDFASSKAFLYPRQSAEFFIPTAYWTGLGGFTRKPSLRVAVFADGQEVSDVPGTGATVEPIFVSSVVGFDGEYAEDSRSVAVKAWNDCGLMPKVISGGAGYTSPPAVAIVGGGGEGATAVAEIKDGSVCKILVTSGGRGYETPPSVQFSGGGGSGAAAEVSILGKVVGFKVLTGGSGYSSSFHVEAAGEQSGSFSKSPFNQSSCLYYGKSIGQFTGFSVPSAFKDRAVVVYADRVAEDDFLSRVPSGSQNVPGFGEVSNIIGICRLSPSPVASLGVLLTGYDSVATKDVDRIGSCEVRALLGDEGRGCTVSITHNRSAAYQSKQFDDEVPTLTLLTSGEGYRCEPQLISGCPNFPVFVDAGPWTEISVSARVSAGIKDGSAWVWGKMPGNPSGFAGDIQYSPSPLGRTVRLAFDTNGDATTQPFAPTVSGPCEHLFDAGGEVFGFLSVPQMRIDSQLSVGNSNTRYSLSCDHPFVPGGRVFFTGIVASSLPTPILYGPSSARRVYCHNGNRYVLDNEGVLWLVASPTTNVIRFGLVRQMVNISINTSNGQVLSSSSGGGAIMTVVATRARSSRAIVGEGRPAAAVSIATSATSLSAFLTQTTSPPVDTYTWNKDSTAYFLGSVDGVKILDNTVEGIVETTIRSQPTNLSWPFSASSNLPPSSDTPSVVEEFSTNRQVFYGTGSVARCGGRWTDFSPESGVGIYEDGTLRFGIVFRDVDHSIYTGTKLPDSYQQEIGPATRLLPGGIVVSGGKAWDVGGLVPRRVFPLSLKLSSPGGNYSIAPSAKATQGAITASAECQFSGTLYACGVLDGGSGYSSPPSVEVSGEGRIEATIEGPLRSAAVTSGGSGYVSPPSVIFSEPGIPASAECKLSCVVSEIVITSGGSGYFTPPAVTVDGDGSGCAAIATIEGSGRVNSITLTSPGAGYTDHPVVSIVGGGGSGAAAEAKVDLDEGSPRYGQVIKLTLLSRGSSYTSTPSVSFSGGGGSGATAAATVAASGTVSSVLITSHGSGYSSAPKISFSGGGGSGASAVARVAGGVADVSIVDGGRYRTPPTFSCQPVFSVDSIAVLSAGDGYRSPPQVLIAGGGGSGATATAFLESNLRNASIKMLNGGSGYVEPPEVVLSGGGGAFATAAASVFDGRVVSVSILDAGEGYSSSPSVSFFGGGGSGASAEVFIPFDRVTLGEPGGGYSKPPSVLFFGGGGSGAAAKASIAALGGGGSGEGTIDGSVVFAKVVSEGSGYQSSPTVSVSPPDLPGGAQAILQSQIVGTVTGFSVQNAGSGYVSSPIDTNREVASDVMLRGSASGYTGPSGGGFAPFRGLYFPGGKLLGNSVQQDFRVSYLYWYEKPDVCFLDTVSCSPVIDMKLCSFGVGKDFEGVNALIDSYYNTSFNKIGILGVGDSSQETSLSINADIVWRFSISQNILQFPVRGFFSKSRYSTPPKVRVVDTVGTGLVCTTQIDQDGFVDERDGEYRNASLSIESPSTSKYSNLLRFVLEGGERIILEPSAVAATQGGRVVEIRVASGGGGFSKPPIVYICGGGGEGAEAVAEMRSEFPESHWRKTLSVSFVRVVSQGSGYTSTPDVVFIHQEEDSPGTGSYTKDQAEKIITRRTVGGPDPYLGWSPFLNQTPTVLVNANLESVFAIKANRMTWRPLTSREAASTILGQIEDSRSFEYLVQFSRDENFTNAFRPLNPVVRTCVRPAATSPELFPLLNSVKRRGHPVVPFFSEGRAVSASIAHPFLSKTYGDATFRMPGAAPSVQVIQELKSIERVSIISPGRGYQSPPRVVFSGGGGSGAAATAELAPDGSISKVTVDSPGWGYSSTPSVSFASESPPQSPAVASAALSAAMSFDLSWAYHHLASRFSGYGESVTMTNSLP